MGSPSLQFYVDKFLVHHLEELIGSSSRTIETYQQSFDRFYIYYFEEYKVPKEEVLITDLTYDVVCDFLNWTEYTKNCSVNTRNLRLYAIKSFALFMIREAPEYIDNFVRIANIPAKKYMRKIISYLSPDGIKAFLCVLDSTGKNKEDYKEYIMVILLLSCGLRSGELLTLKASSFNLDIKAPYVKVIGKGNKPRIVPFLPDIIAKLMKYFEFFGINPQSKKTQDNYIFLDNTGNPYTVKQFGAVIKRLKNLAKRYFPALIPADLSAYKLRHSFAMNCLNNGMELIYLRDLLGLSSVKTTERYARLVNVKAQKESLFNCLREVIPGTQKQKEEEGEAPKKILVVREPCDD